MYLGEPRPGSAGVKVWEISNPLPTNPNPNPCVCVQKCILNVCQTERVPQTPSGLTFSHHGGLNSVPSVIPCSTVPVISDW